MKRKRIGFAIGMMLLMGGWGLTWYADEQQQTVSMEGRRQMLWTHGRAGSGNYRIDTIPSRWVYAAGIMLMTVGAGVTAFYLPLPESWK